MKWLVTIGLFISSILLIVNCDMTQSDPVETDSSLSVQNSIDNEEGRNRFCNFLDNKIDSVIEDEERADIVKNEFKTIIESLHPTSPREATPQQRPPHHFELLKEEFLKDEMNLDQFTAEFETKHQEMKERLVLQFPHFKTIIETMTQDERQELVDNFKRIPGDRPPRHNREEMRERMEGRAKEHLQKMVEAVELTEEQQAELETILPDMRDNSHFRRHQGWQMIIFTDLKDEFVEGTLTEEQLANEIDSKMEANREKANEFHAFIVKIHDLLSSEQRAKLVEFLKENKPRMGHGPDDRPGNCPGNRPGNGPGHGHPPLHNNN